jgi:outer membrane receptor protein involved in Fe transport
MTRTAATSQFSQQTDQTVKAGVGSFNTGFIYDPDEFNDLNVDVSYNNTAYQTRNNTWNSQTINGISSLYQSESKSEGNSGGLTTSLYYKRRFDKNAKHNLEAELRYYNNLGNNTTTDFRNSYYDPIDTMVLYSIPWQHERSESKVQTVYGQSNYTLPFDSLWYFNAGLSVNYLRYLTDNTSSVIQATDLDYSDWRLGGYAELSRDFSKGNVRLGTRLELSQVTFVGSDPHEYHSILPYVNALYRVNKDNSLKLAYSRRVIRPSSGQLNPMVSVVDSQTISCGNPDLKPAYRDNFQLTYNWRLDVKKIGFNLSPQVYYEYKTGLIQTILSQNSQTHLFESKQFNISNGYESGGSLALSSQIGPFMFNSNIRYSIYHIDPYRDQITVTNRRGWNWNAFAMCPLPKNYQLMGLLNLTGPSVSGQTETRISAIYLIGVGKQFKNNSVLRLMAYNPFAENFVSTKAITRSPFFQQEQHSYLKKDYGFLLMYVYSFKVGNLIERAKRTIEESTSPTNLLNLPVSIF